MDTKNRVVVWQVVHYLRGVEDTWAEMLNCDNVTAIVLVATLASRYRYVMDYIDRKLSNFDCHFLNQ